MKDNIDFTFFTAFVIIVSAGEIALAIALGLNAIAVAIAGAG